MNSGVGFWFAMVVIALALAVSRADASDLPNIVLIMADDMGYGDAACYNSDSKIATPAIDRLAQEGIRFTDAHAPAAVCVPTRYGLLTGRYPFRMPHRNGPLLDANQLTIGGLLKRHGYKTACVGKWHLGFEQEKSPRTGQQLQGGPIDHGFDNYFGIPASLDIPPYYFIEDDRCLAAPSNQIEANYSDDVTRIQGAFWRAGGIAPGFRHIDVLPKFVERAVAFIDREPQTDAGQPFFLYLALPAPHTPWLPLPEFQGKTACGDYGDFAAQVDAGVGRVLAALERRDANRNTLVIFTSDNGPVWYPADVERYGHRSTGELRGMKGDAWEGGHRMPFIAKWPGRISPGTTTDQLVCHTDLLATFAAIVGEQLDEGQITDSYDISPFLFGDAPPKRARNTLISQSSKHVLAIRRGHWKLIPQLGSGGFSVPSQGNTTEDGPRGQLYDLSQDLGETRNLWQKQPEVVEQLTQALGQITGD